ncbi:MAG: pyridoxal 5'-phosphate synthase [Thermoleophilales bacterium]|nr:pyridoxal 5'-phosphate synthase [Thermoleophilales bacterium]
MDSPPIAGLRRWLVDAENAGAPHPWSAIFVTVSADGDPSARTVTLKRLDRDSLLFTSALWTRKVAELRANPKVAIAFHWPGLGRQTLIRGTASEGDRRLAGELFAERGLDHQLQAHVSRQGQVIDSLEPLRRRRLELIEELDGGPVPCPDGWGVVRVDPECVEFWEETPDRLHDRIEHWRVDGEWNIRRLAP